MAFNKHIKHLNVNDVNVNMLNKFFFLFPELPCSFSVALKKSNVCKTN